MRVIKKATPEGQEIMANIKASQLDVKEGRIVGEDEVFKELSTPMKSITRWRVFSHGDERICEGRLYGIGRTVINGAPILMFDRVWLGKIIAEELQEGGFVVDAKNGRFELHGPPPDNPDFD